VGQPDYSSGCMLALYPPPSLAGDLAVPGGLPAAEMHVTVAYLGDAADVDLTKFTAAAETLLDRAPVRGAVSGHARFTGGASDVIVALIDSAGLEDLRGAARTALAGAGIEIPREHGYTPHLTLRYQDADDPDPLWRLPARPVTFTHLAVVWGKERTNLPFRLTETAHPITPYARQAYMAGWAASGGPFTPRVLAGCHAAAAWAAGHATQPGVLETALKLGSLEGSWAVIYRRRDELIKTSTETVTGQWRTLIHALNARSLVSKYRALAGLHGETATPGGKDRRKEAASLAAAWLYGILDDPRYQQLAAAIAAALRAGLAEGSTGARINAAETAGIAASELDIDVMFTAAYEALAGLPSLPGMGDEWVHKIIGGCASDLGRVLAKLAEDGATYQDMLDAVMHVAGSTSIRAVTTLLDHAISGAITKGAIALYRDQRVALLNWVTAGDGRVCAECEGLSDDGPYPPDQFPPCPDHVGCRCTPEPADELPATVFTPYLKTGGG